ncbi:hypothetical protein [Brucella anthropi]|uniref:hypothetical protein n=1 Tax=Brucella anthropi TaxID=529 RepID=UPI002448FB3E|nr:hypothetical protein [Brucella anthropi]MDH0368019.1 hypothetical protein [Brucella anthropi]
MASELKPCICGKTPRLGIKKGSAGITKTPFYREQIVCRCGVSSKIFKAPNKAVEAWNTRPAPAATDTGLVTAELRQEIFELAKDLFWRVDGNQRLWSSEEREIYGLRAAMQIARSRAEELLAAERAENTRLQSENDAQADQISELQMTPWPEWATKVLAVIRKRSGYDGYGDAIEGVDLPAELDECIAAIEADNAAKDAAYKRLEQQAIKDRKLRDEAQSDADLWRFSVDMGDHPSLLVKVWKQRKALEAKLAAAQEALEPFAAVLEDYDPDWEDDDVSAVLVVGSVTHYGITLGNFRKARAVLGGKLL